MWVPSALLATQVTDVRRDVSTAVPHLSLAAVEFDPGMTLEGIAKHVVYCAHPGRLAEDIHVIEEGGKVFARI